MSHEGSSKLTKLISLTRDICLFQGGHIHMQSELLQETGAKKGCGRRGGAGGETPLGNATLAITDHCLAS